MEAFLSIFAFFILLLLDNSRAQSAGFWVTFFFFLLSVFRFYSSLRREYCSWLSEFHALGLLKVLFFFFFSRLRLTRSTAKGLHASSSGRQAKASASWSFLRLVAAASRFRLFSLVVIPDPVSICSFRLVTFSFFYYYYFPDCAEKKNGNIFTLFFEECVRSQARVTLAILMAGDNARPFSVKRTASVLTGLCQLL